MEPGSNFDFQKYFLSASRRNETSRQKHANKEPNVAANKLNDIPEAPQEVKKYLRDVAVENMERIKTAEIKKENQSNDADRASRKRKSETNEKLTEKKEAVMLEPGNRLIPAPLSHIPLKTLLDIETKLVYIDEEEIFFEFAEVAMPAGRRSAHRGCATTAMSAPSVPRVDKQLQVALWDASDHYRQKNYAVAAAQFTTALEVRGAREITV